MSKARGIVMQNTGRGYLVRLHDGTDVTCEVAMPEPGDRVTVRRAKRDARTGFVGHSQIIQIDNPGESK